LKPNKPNAGKELISIVLISPYHKYGRKHSWPHALKPMRVLLADVDLQALQISTLILFETLECQIAFHNPCFSQLSEHSNWWG